MHNIKLRLTDIFVTYDLSQTLK